MKFVLRVHVACVLLGWLTTSAAGAEGGIPQPYVILKAHGTDEATARRMLERIVPEPIPEGDPAAGSIPWEEVAPGENATCETCGSGGTCASRGCLGGLWSGSVDYLLFRPRMSQAAAAVRHVETTDSSSAIPTSTTTNTAVQYPFTYQSGFRVAAGYRLLDCGGDAQFSYWRMSSDARYRTATVDSTNNSLLIFGNMDNNPADGEYLDAGTGVTANIFDIDFAKSVSLGGPCSTCGGCGCPRWDLRFWSGVRIADISRFNDNQVFDDEGNGLAFAQSHARFVGAGPRVGIQGRRFFGPCGRWSFYSKASGAILLGDYRQGRSLTVPIADPVELEITNQDDVFTRAIPVVDVEVGATWQVAPYTFVSIGYFLQSWWDLGQGETIQGSSVPGVYFGPLDTSNILGFDGMFVRGEMLF